MGGRQCAEADRTANFVERCLLSGTSGHSLSRRSTEWTTVTGSDEKSREQERLQSRSTGGASKRSETSRPSQVESPGEPGEPELGPRPESQLGSGSASEPRSATAP